MALIICPVCGKKVSDKAVACPHCSTSMDTIIKSAQKAAGNKSTVTANSTNSVSGVQSVPVSTTVTSPTPRKGMSEKDLCDNIRKEMQLGYFESAMKKVDVLIAKYPDSVAFANLKLEIKDEWLKELKSQAESFEQSNDTKVAKDLYVRILKINPNDAVARRKLNDFRKDEERIKAEQDEKLKQQMAEEDRQKAAKEAERKQQRDENRQKRKSKMDSWIQKAKKILLVSAIVVAVALLGYLGYALYQKSQIVDVPNEVTSSDMVALFSLSSTTPHIASAYSNKFVEFYKGQVDDALATESDAKFAEVLEITKDIKGIVEKMGKMAEGADEDDKFTLKKNIDVLNKLAEKVRSAEMSMKKEVAEPINKKSVNASDYSGNDLVAGEPIYEDNYNSNERVVVKANAYDGFVNIRQKPSGESAILGRLNNEEDVAMYIGETESWYKVQFNGIIGYVIKKYSYTDEIDY